MKKPRSSSPAAPAAPATAAPKAAGEAPGSRRPGARRGFKLAALAAPLLLLGLLELALRAIGIGYPTAFFLPTRLGGRDVLIENQAFARRYFPPGLERTPQPMVFDAAKPPGTVRIFVFGESAALGDPEPAYGFPRQLEVLLQGALPGRRVEVLTVALTAINSHVLRDIARDCAGQTADFWILYMGNNEVVGPFGAGTVFGDQVPPLGVIRANLALKTTRTGQLLDAVRWRLARGNAQAAPAEWEGMEMFLHQQVPAGDPRLARTYANFEANVREIAALGRQSGARVLVTTVAVNTRDCAPFASVHRPDLDAGRLAEWRRLRDSGRAHLDAGRLAEAVQSFVQAAAIDDRPAEIHYALGRTRLALGQTNDARAAFERALEQDALRFRADARINGILRDIAARTPGAQLVDVAASLAAASPDGLCGEELFYEHVHFHPEGNHAVARLLAGAITTSLGEGAAALPSRERCLEELACTEFDRHRVLDEVRGRLERPPFTGQFDHAARAARIRRQLDASGRASLTNALAAYDRAIAGRPADWELRANYATLLKDFDRLDDALVHWKKAGELVPHSVDTWLGVADTLDALGRSPEALVWYRRALRARPAAVETRNGLALALAGAGDVPGAIRELELALRERPNFAEARVNLGRLLAQQGRTAEAMSQYRDALRSNSNSVAARINLGKLLSGEGRPAEAAAEYREAIRLKPGHAVAHFNLGNALATLQDRPGALRHYAEAARLNPRFTEARHQLGLAFARDNRNAEALAEFTEVVRLDPRFASGRFNLGVALAKAGRFAEAEAEFQETLRLEPDNAQARKFLEQARDRLGRSAAPGR